ncbi:hypothetical protein [Maridesulfovibrio sp.]|uniref:hypothetical protein n=1 Tax=Maridesulfovibrio sp. TaxID=2795000 RepID=UPI0029F4A356|nr:hypothetical protein [Maridesulfovibrio sp.]
MKKIIVILVCSLLIAATAYAEDIRLKCDTHRIIISGNSNLVQLVGTSVSRNGTYSQDGRVYHIVFPASEISWEVSLNIFKESGEYTWEHGTKPFGKENKQNAFFTGKCSKYKSLLN